MQYQYVPYIWPLIISGVLSLSLGIYTLIRYRYSKDTFGFVLSMFVVTLWSIPNAMEMLSVDFSTKLFWANVQYFAYCYSPVTLLILCMQFTGYEKWIQNKRIIWVAVLPTIILLLVWTDGMHGLMRYDIHMDYSGSFPVIVKKYGFAFYIHTVYSYCLNLTTLILLIRAAFFNKRIYRKQAIALLFGVSLIAIPNVLYVLGLSPIKQFDITPIFFGPASFIVIWAIFRYKLFDLVPLARATVFETMDAGVLVVDLQNRVLDCNPSFEKMFGFTFSQITSKKVEDLCIGIPELFKVCRDWSILHAEFSMDVQSVSRTYEIFLSPLTNRRNILLGRIALMYEITDKRKVEQEFLRQQRKLAVVEERERMARDMHDNLGQVLGFINMQAQAIQQELNNEGIYAVSEKLDRLVKITQSAHIEIREYISNVRSSTYLVSDFIVGLKEQIDKFKSQTQIDVNLNLPKDFGNEIINVNSQINIFNIIKESLNNVRKHAEAKCVTISIVISENLISITIEDDGKGFDIQRSADNDKTKLGLNIMRERASEINGKIHIESVVGKGSRIILKVPIDTNAC